MEHLLAGLSGAKNKKNTFFEKRTGEVVENKGSGQKANRSEPKRETEKLLKTRSCGKNEPETNPRTKLPIFLKTHKSPKSDLQWPGANVHVPEAEPGHYQRGPNLT